MEVREGKIEEVHQISRILVKSSTYAYSEQIPKDHLDKIEDDQYVTYLKNVIKKEDKKCFVACEEDKILGAACIGPSRLKKYKDDLELMTLYVDPDFFGQRAGFQLMKKIKAYAMAYNYKRISLWCLKDNERARDFYYRQGFYRNGDEEFITVAKTDLTKARYVFEF